MNIDVARKGFAVDASLMKSIQGKVVNDGRASCSKGVSSSGAAEKVSSSRIAARNTVHTGTIQTVIQSLQKQFREFTSSNCNHGEARKGVKDPGKHLTAGIAVSVSGNIPTLFITVRKKGYSNLAKTSQIRRVCQW